MLERRKLFTTEKTAVFAPSASAIVSTATAQAALRRRRKRRPASRPRERTKARMVSVRMGTAVRLRHAMPAPSMRPTQPPQAVHNDRSYDPHLHRGLEESAEPARFGGEAGLFARREGRMRFERHQDTVLLERAPPDADELSVDDENVWNQRIRAGHRRCSAHALTDRAPVAKADEVL